MLRELSLQRDRRIRQLLVVHVSQPEREVPPTLTRNSTPIGLPTDRG